MEVVDAKDLVMRPYYGPKNMKIVLAYTPFKNLNNEYFVIMRPHDLVLIPMWMGRIQSDVVKDDQNEFFKMVMVQWWVLVKKGQIQMNNVCMKIVGMVSGNVIHPFHNSG